MEIRFLGNTNKYLDDKAKNHLIEALPTYISSQSSKIKPIHIDVGYQHLYELKINIKGKYYRLAYYYLEDIVCFFISEELIKQKFEKELKRYINKYSLHV